jgi:putative SOS response-associated peptidase YedK
MCGRFLLTTSGAELAEHFGLAATPNLAPRYNIAPTQQIAAVFGQLEASRHLSLARWGLIPAGTREPARRPLLINARAETAMGKPAFRDAFRHRRCLVPATGFYEWQRTAKPKLPHVFMLRDGAPMALAGLWERWERTQDSPLVSCTIMTTTANDLVRSVHERMPVILPVSAFAQWLAADPVEPDMLPTLLTPYPSGAMTATALGTYVNSASHDGPECLDPA